MTYVHTWQVHHILYQNINKWVAALMKATMKDLRKVVLNITHAIMWSFEVWSELDA